MGDEEKSLDAILGESLSDAYDAAESAPEAGDASQPDAAPASAAPSDGRMRDEQGRFAPKTDSQAAPSAPAATTVAKPNTDQGSKPDDGAAPAVAPSDVPASWPAALKNHWVTLPPELKSHLQSREADFARGIEQKTRGFEALEQVIAPRRVGLAAEYGSVENAVGTLFKLSDFAAQDKPGFVKWFCQAHNLDPQAIFGGAANPAPQPGDGGHVPASPDMAAVEARIRDVETRVVEALQAPIKAKAQTELQKFEGEAATKYPHYSNPQVKSAMANTLAGSADDMTYEQAYERVVWSIPELRQQLLEKERTDAVEAKAKEAAEAARKARNTAGPQLRSVGTPNAMRAAPRGIDDTLSEVWDRNMGAA